MRSDIEVGLAPAARQRSFRVLRISWADSIPKLLQARLIESFENYDIAHAPLRTPDIGQADFQLLIEVRCFRIVAQEHRQSELGLSRFCAGLRPHQTIELDLLPEMPACGLTAAAIPSRTCCS